MWCQYDTIHILKTGTPKIITVIVQIKNSLGLIMPQCAQKTLMGWQTM